MTWSEANDYLIEYNRKLGYTHKGNEKVCTMVTLISEDSFTQPYTLEERSYKFTSDNKAFLPKKLNRKIPPFKVELVHLILVILFLQVV